MVTEAGGDAPGDHAPPFSEDRSDDPRLEPIGGFAGEWLAIARIGEDHFRCRVAIRNPMGLHARPASLFVELANRFPCEVRLRKGNDLVDGKSILQLMSLSAEKGVEVELETFGPEASAAIAALRDLVANGFNELGDGE